MNLKDIPVTNNINYDDEFDELEEGEYIYQFQPLEDKNLGALVIVGKTLNHSDIMINKFDYKKKTKCHLVSCLYNEAELEKIQSTCIFPIIKLTAFDEKTTFNKNKCKTKLQLYGILQYNFHTFHHTQDKNHIINFASDDKEDLNELKGFYSITFHKNEKMVYMAKYKEALTRTNMIKTLIEKFILTQSEKIL
jgi:hypothetical protein